MWSQLYLAEAAALFFVLLGLVAFILPSKITDVLGLFVLTVILFYGFRAFLLVSGLDVPDPAVLFPPSQRDSMMTAALLWMSLYLALFGVAAFIALRASTQRTTTAIFMRNAPSLKRMLAVTIALTAVGSVITLQLLIRFGSVGAMVNAVKVDKALAGLYLLKIPAAVGAVIGIATFLELRRRKGPGRWQLVALGCGVINSASSLAWGQRSIATVSIALLALGMLESSRRSSSFLRPRTVGVVVLTAVLVAAASFSLRVWRDTVTRGDAQAAISQGSVWRRVSVATNSESFDRAMMILRDWPAVHDYRGGTDFASGAVSFIPRSIWPGKPAANRTGAAFRQIYEPHTRNGWPPQAPMDWYLNFGPLGFIINAILAGAVFGFLSAAQRRASSDALNMVIAAVAAIFVFQLGLPTDTTGRFVGSLLPLVLLGWYLTRNQPTAELELAPTPLPRQTTAART